MRRNVMTDAGQDKVKAAFKAMRKAGLTAKMNFSCCSGCACYDIASKASSDKDAGKTVNAGYAFYHKQDGTRLRESGECHIAYGRMSCSKHGDLGDLTTEQIGEKVVECLTAAGITTEWDGKASSRILMKVCGE